MKVEPAHRASEEMHMGGSLAEDSSSASPRGHVRDSSQPSLLPFEYPALSDPHKLQAKASQTHASSSPPAAPTAACPQCDGLARGHDSAMRQLSQQGAQQRQNQCDSKSTLQVLHAAEGQLAQTKIHLDEPARVADQLPEDRDALLARLLAERDQWQRQREQVAADFGSDRDRLVQRQEKMVAQLQDASHRYAQLAVDGLTLRDDNQKLFNRLSAELSSRNKAVLAAQGLRQRVEEDLRQLRAQMDQLKAEAQAAKKVLADERNQWILLQQHMAAAQQQLVGEKAALARSLQEQHEQSIRQQGDEQAELQRQIAALRSERDRALTQLQKQQRQSAAAVAAAAAAAATHSSRTTEQASRHDLERSLQQLSQQLTQQQQRGRTLEQQLAQASAGPSQLRSQLGLAQQQLQRVRADAIQAKDAHAALSRQLTGVMAENQRMSQTNQLLHRQALDAEAEKQRNEQAIANAAALQRLDNGCMLRVTSRPAGCEKWSGVW